MRSSRTLVLAVAVLAWIVVLSAVPATGAGPDGKALFLAQKCNLCHSIDAAGIQRTSKSEKTKGPDLGGVVARRDAAWMKRFLSKDVDVNGKKHLKTFTGTPQELDALIAWLRTQ